MVGGRGSPRKICRARLSISSVSQLLRQRCEARGFKPLSIENIARRKATPAFEPRNCGGWRIAQARETGAPSRTCKLLFGNLAVQILLLVPADRPVRQPEPIQGGRLSLPIQCRESTTLSGHTGLLRWTRIWAKSASSSDQNTTFQSRFILTTVMP